MAHQNNLIATPQQNISDSKQPHDTIVDCSSLVIALEHFLELIDSGDFLLLDESQKGPLREHIIDLLDKARHSGSMLVMGIVGGTGVGKSTLINALAGEEISKASDRRPYTSRAVVYRHQEAEISFDTRDDLLKKPDAVHGIGSMRDLVIMDMPDFDSHEKKNVETVLELLPLLDIVVWVVSPEKYADASLFDFIRDCKTHKDNFVFVFNKSDQLLDEIHDDGHVSMREALGDFLFHLKKVTGINNPMVFSLSCQQEISGLTPDQFLGDEFTRFREFITACRKAKEIESIKFLNLMNQSVNLFNQIESEIRPDLKRKAIQLIVDMRQDQPSVRPFEGDTATITKIASYLMGQLLVSDNSLPSIKLAMNLLTFRRYDISLHDFSLPIDRIRESLSRQIEPYLREAYEIQGRTDSEALLGSLGKVTKMQPSHLSDLCSEIVERSVSQAQNVSGLTGSKIGSVLSRAFQKILLSVPAALFVLGLFGRESLHRIFFEYDIKESLWSLVTLGSRLFAPEGLSAIVSLILVEIVLIMWMANRRVKKLRKKSHRLAMITVKQLQTELESQVNKVVESTNENVRRISESLDRLQHVHDLFRPGR